MLGLFGERWDIAIFVFSFLFGLFALPLYALSAAHMNDSVESGGFVEASSGLLLLYAAGAIVGPLFASTAMRLTGPEGLFFYTSAVHLLMAVFAVYRMCQRGRRSEAEREPFLDSIRVAQTVATIDPLAKTGDDVSPE